MVSRSDALGEGEAMHAFLLEKPCGRWCCEACRPYLDAVWLALAQLRLSGLVAVHVAEVRGGKRARNALRQRAHRIRKGSRIRKGQPVDYLTLTTNGGATLWVYTDNPALLAGFAPRKLTGPEAVEDYAARLAACRPARPDKRRARISPADSSHGWELGAEARAAAEARYPGVRAFVRKLRKGQGLKDWQDIYAVCRERFGPNMPASAEALRDHCQGDKDRHGYDLVSAFDRDVTMDRAKEVLEELNCTNVRHGQLGDGPRDGTTIRADFPDHPADMNWLSYRDVVLAACRGRVPEPDPMRGWAVTCEAVPSTRHPGRKVLRLHFVREDEAGMSRDSINDADEWNGVTSAPTAATAGVASPCHVGASGWADLPD
jgi:hypothetical protein